MVRFGKVTCHVGTSRGRGGWLTFNTYYLTNSSGGSKPSDGGGGGGGSHLERDIRGRAVSKKNFLPLWDLSLVLK